MRFHHNRQSQFELFPGASNQSTPKTKSRFFMSQVTFSFENLIIFGIIIIISMVMSFSLGVDRGYKRSRLKEVVQKEEVSQEDSAQVQEVATEPEIVKASVISPRETIVSVTKAQASDVSRELDVIEEKAGQNTEKFYTVQVASFRTEEYAQKEAMDLKKTGYEILVVPKGNYSIVCVGKFLNHHEAKLFSRKLKNKYKDCLVRSL